MSQFDFQLKQFKVEGMNDIINSQDRIQENKSMDGQNYTSEDPIEE